jgi:NAD(P)-dependent dehydrogenase (short-subunit alcohol dehydrogenase family)
MAFELNQFGIGMKTVSPGGMKTDFVKRSFDAARHASYDASLDRVMARIADPKQMETYSSPGQMLIRQ